MKKTFFVAGGDARQRTIVQMLKDRGESVCAFGLEGENELTAEAASALSRAEVVLLPLPAEKEAGMLNLPLAGKPLALAALYPMLHPRQLILGGKLSEQFLSDASQRHLRVVDYFKREDFALRNAYITAEGAIQRTMEHERFVLRDLKCLVLGYGRIGAYLAKLLRGMGAEVTASARRSEILARVELDGCRSWPLDRLQEILPEFDVIYNTIPQSVLKRMQLRQVRSGCYCMDLASPPGGIDLSAAAELGLDTLWASGLPGKTAPASAGKAILDTVDQILKEEVPS